MASSDIISGKATRDLPAKHSFGRPWGQAWGLSAIHGLMAKAIRQLREKRGVTQEAVAHSTGITTATLGVIERGLSNPTWATIKSIGGALGVKVSELAKAAEKIEG